MAKIALILGGTKGLGLSLAWEADRRQIKPIITGRSAGDKKVKAILPSDSVGIYVDFRLNADITLKPQALADLDYVFWVAGVLKEKPLKDFTYKEIMEMTEIHYTGPIEFLRNLTRNQFNRKKSFHLITISSTSSWRIRDNQAIYCSLQAAKSAFTTNFSRELARDLPGSKTMLVHPGGMKTDLFKGTNTDTFNFMDTDVVAKIIWDEVESQRSSFKELQIMRNDDGSPNVSYGPRTPELPF